MTLGQSKQYKIEVDTPPRPETVLPLGLLVASPSAEGDCPTSRPQRGRRVEILDQLYQNSQLDRANHHMSRPHGCPMPCLAWGYHHSPGLETIAPTGKALIHSLMNPSIYVSICLFINQSIVLRCRKPSNLGTRVIL